ncbi:hypothetical protein LIA77_01171 [Sarocladium implicatum]|nr:hypothetical protein LIA77_01171 [Sarocladium implicatum]
MTNSAQQARRACCVALPARMGLATTSQRPKRAGSNLLRGGHLPGCHEGSLDSSIDAYFRQEPLPARRNARHWCATPFLGVKAPDLHAAIVHWQLGDPESRDGIPYSLSVRRSECAHHTGYSILRRCRSCSFLFGHACSSLSNMCLARHNDG